MLPLRWQEFLALRQYYLDRCANGVIDKTHPLSRVPHTVRGGVKRSLPYILLPPKVPTHRLGFLHSHNIPMITDDLSRPSSGGGLVCSRSLPAENIMGRVV